MRKCPSCGNALFDAIPGETTVADIVNFLNNHPMFKKMRDKEWIHPGTHCTVCDFELAISTRSK